jgi:hypothetical protein
MKKITFLLLIIPGLIMSQAPNWAWVKRSTGSINEAVACITTDSNNNVYAAGSIISDNANFGLGTLGNNGYADYFIAKYNVSGTPLWVRNGGGEGNDIVYNITTDASNNVYALVSFQSGSITFGNFTINNTATIPQNGLLTYDLALVKYDADGNALWVKKIGGFQDENNTTLVCDTLGNVYITASSGSQILTAASLTVSATQNNYVGGIMFKIDSAGNDLWIKRFGANLGVNTPFLTTPVFDTLGNFYLTGRFDTQTFTLGSTTYTNVEPGISDSFIGKFDSNGNLIWQKALQGNGDDKFEKILLIQDELYVPYSVTANQPSTSSVYSYDGVNYDNSNSATVGLMKMNLSGQISSIFFNPIFSNLGSTDGNSLFFIGGQTATFPVQNVYVTKMNLYGQVIWSKTQTGSNSFSPLALTIDSAGALLFGGYFGGYFVSSNLTLDSTTLVNSSLSGFIDAIVAKLNSTSLSNLDFHKENVLIYPNPSKDFITINTDNEIQKVTISDLNGRMLSIQFDSIVNLSNLIPGIYILNIESENGTSSKKIIKE